MLQLAGKADESSKSAGFTGGSQCLCSQGQCPESPKDSGADPGSHVTLQAHFVQTQSVRVAKLPADFRAFSVLFTPLFFPETEERFTSNPFLCPRSGHVPQP